MAKCPKCRYSFNVPEDEQDDHECPNCGHGREWNICQHCDGNGYILVPAKDIHGEDVIEPEDCPYCTEEGEPYGT